MRVLVVGCGSIGTRHARNLRALGVDPIPCDIDGEKAAALADELGVTGGWTWAGLDAVVVATPYENHLQWVEAAVNSRLPFLVEKPLGSLEQLPRWRELAATDLPVHQVGYMLRFNEHAGRLREIPDRVRAAFMINCNMTTWPGRSYGPPLLEASHEIDLALWFGADRLIRAAKDHACDCEIDWHNSAVWINTGSSSYVRAWSVSRGDGQVSAIRFVAPEHLGDQMYYDEMAHFLDCVRTGKQSTVAASLVDGLRVLEICAQVEAVAKA